MLADFSRYHCEVLEGEDLEQVKKEATEYYKFAETNSIGLSNINPLKLGLFLNISVFQFEILQDVKEAVFTAEKANR